MSNDLIEELAEAAYNLWKADQKIPGKKKKKPAHSFMDYDDAMNKLDDMAVDGPAAMVMVNTRPPSSTTTQQPIFYRKHLKKRPRPSHKHRLIPNIAQRKKFRPAPDAYVLPPDGLSHRKRSR